MAVCHPNRISFAYLAKPTPLLTPLASLSILVEMTWPRGLSMFSSSCSSMDTGKLEMYRLVGSCSCCCRVEERGGKRRSDQLLLGLTWNRQQLFVMRRLATCCSIASSGSKLLLNSHDVFPDTFKCSHAIQIHSKFKVPQATACVCVTVCNR